MKITVGIKALNEEAHIEKALVSALAAVEPYGGEVILADSGSSDRTIAIARRFPITIVQLANPTERSCGAGAQLAFQQADGDFFYLLDGDMVLQPDFLPACFAYLADHPEVAGVGGRVREMNLDSHEFQIRAKSTAANKHVWMSGIVDRLDGGGLYRTSAVREVGYFADRNLHAFEEFELGARLQARGWKLARIDALAVEHFGHRLDGYQLLWKRFRSGNTGAAGEVLRGAIGRDHLKLVTYRLGHIRNEIAVLLWWALAMAVLFSPLVAAGKLVLLGLFVIGPVMFLAIRRRSLRLGLYSFASWNVGALGFLRGFIRPRTSPTQPIATVILARANSGGVSR